MRHFKVSVISIIALAIWAATALLPTTARAQIFVSTSYNTIGEYTTAGGTVNASLLPDLPVPCGIVLSGSNMFVAQNGNGTIGEYTTSGGTVNSSLASGLDGPFGIALSGSNLFVTNFTGNYAPTNTVGEYTTSGGTVSAPLIPGLMWPTGIAVSGSDIFVANEGNGSPGAGSVAEYTLSGSVVNASLITGLYQPTGIAITGSDIFVTSYNGNPAGGGTIGEYTTSGGTMNASLISGLNGPFGVAVYEDNLYVVNHGDGTIGEYTTAGDTVNASLVSGLYQPDGIAVVPEPSALALLSICGLALPQRRRPFPGLNGRHRSAGRDKISHTNKRREHVMRLTIGTATILLMFSAAALLAQVSPEEALQKMQDRIAQEKAAAGQQAIDATQPSNLTNGQVAQLYKTITQQKNEIAQLTAEVQQLKDKFALSQLNLRNAQAAADAATAGAKDAPGVAANGPTPSDIEAAIGQRTLVVGMTLDQCNQAIGKPGEITGANGSLKYYEWYEYTYQNGVLAPAGYKGPVSGMLPFTGTIENGKLVNFDKGLWRGM